MKDDAKRWLLALVNVLLFAVNLLYVFATPFVWLIPLHVVFCFLNGLTAWEYMINKRDE